MPRCQRVHDKRSFVALCAFNVVAVLVAASSSAVRAAPPAKENSKAAEAVRGSLTADAEQSATADRRKLLADVVQQNPEFAPARWQSGYVMYEGKWRTPDEVQTIASADTRLQQYSQLRAESLPTVASQAALARWCRKNKLEIEERFHWLKVLEAEPNHPEALSRLRLRWVGGWLLTPEQHEKYLTLRRKVDADIKTWKPRVTAWQRAIERGTDEEKQTALDQLSQVTDPAAVIVLEWIVRSKDLSQQATQFRLAVVAALAGMKNQPATETLVRIAATATDQQVCDAAADGLKQRPIRTYAPLLLAAMATPVESEFTISSAGGDVFYQHRFFRGGAEINDYAETNTMVHVVGVGENARESAIQTWNVSPAQKAARNNAQTSAFVQAAVAARSTELAVAQQNKIVSVRNQRLKYVLTRASSIDLPADPQSWWSWWQGYNELHVAERPTRSYSDDQYVEETYNVPTGLPRTSSCFVRGTPVWTLTGKRAIETVQVGDRVLSQHPSTGELAYVPVLRTTVRPASPTVRINLPGETLTATRGHNFWSVGSGWIMAKDLKTESTLYALPASVRIQSITEGEPAEAYNLIVADYGTYFVGENRILSHDNTLPLPSDGQLVPGVAAGD